MLQLLMALNHPNIVRCVECFIANSKLCIVMDWCSEGECARAPIVSPLSVHGLGLHRHGLVHGVLGG